MDRKNYNRIKAAMAEKRVSQKYLAEKLGVTVGTVSTWCRNFKQPEVPTLFQIADVLNVEAASLLTAKQNLESL
ncbi:helix-turn-helix transcriptional regulator [Parasegetibacter sp. NRK P23]|uniref:helix-turn-helix transcriptional regulator n=1 Tax=Parasegetibacter sp. NRK P23 TaxID=2942999 RepID=UPI0020442B58|nr:helix-turn-helix transcriptional regulator [Parasegetibacter sp. NRK P23]MCM5529797.1 helix-turn-helix domain-containing protein [Parasegetibacter sp. NRK P23]